ncbi:MAG: hypothetical protein KIT33_10325 [Candidatus Kapabacteria bacterium]|nr:hypothetical protein [Ignavibacteriota bacterium]MCW5885354.1 hypothetical protein [Candidatus Kapabacteria bacterium]
MTGKFKNIIVLILLVIFPISAIGLNITVHKCKLKGSIDYSFFSSTNNNNEFICGCKITDINPTAHQEASSCCNNTNMEEKSGDNNETNNQYNKNTGIQILKSACCSDSDLSYSINDDFITNIKTNILSNFAIVNNVLYSNKCFNLFRTSDYFIKDTEYPIQELICHTISFIHFSSQSKNDSEEPPIHKC